MRMTNGPGEFHAAIAWESCPTALMSRDMRIQDRDADGVCGYGALLADAGVAGDQDTIELYVVWNRSQCRLVGAPEGDDVARPVLVGLEGHPDNTVVARAGGSRQRGARGRRANCCEARLVARIDPGAGRRQCGCRRDQDVLAVPPLAGSVKVPV